MAGKNDHNPYGDEHPFDKVFDQIEQLMKVLDANKDKPPKEIPPFIEDELKDVEEQFERLQKVVTQTIPASLMNEEDFRLLMREVPEEDRPVENDLVERGRRLKKELQTIQESREKAKAKPKSKAANEEEEEKSPMELLGEGEAKQSDKDLRASLENKKKYGRMGGRKNWRPM